MKKICIAGVFALAIVALSQQQASAWLNARFGAGLNWSMQSGGNQILWGAWRNGQPPGPEAFQGAPHGFPQFGMRPGAQAYPAQGFQPQGYPMMPQAYAPFPQNSFDFSTAEPPITALPMFYSSPYQFANYPRPVYYYYGR